MTEAQATTEFYYFISMVVVVFVANSILGFMLSPGNKFRAVLWPRSRIALVQSFAFTAVGFLATIRPGEQNDGQTGMAIPILWLPFFAASVAGLLIAPLLSQVFRSGSRRPD